MQRYLRLLRVFYKASILTELEYRANFLMHGFYSIAWTAWVWFGVAIFFQHGSNLAGWSYYEALVVVGLFQIFGGLIDGFLRPNIVAVIDHVRKGTLDFILLKPADSQFLVSTRKIIFWKFLDISVGGAVIIFALSRLQIVPSAGQILLFGVMMLIGIVMLYAVWMTMITTAFWFVRVDNVSELLYTFFEAGRFPIGVFNGVIRFVLTFVVPIAFMTTFPAAVLLGKLEWDYVWIGMGLAALLFLLSVRFWRYALRFYTSASS